MMVATETVSIESIVRLQTSGEIDAAIDLGRRLVASEPSHQARHLLGTLLLQGQQPAEAIEILGPLAAETSDSVTRLHLALAQRKIGAVDAAEMTLRSLIDDHPGLAEAYYNLGLVLLDTRPLDTRPLDTRPLDTRSLEAVEAFEHAVRLRPDWAQAIGNLGVAYNRSGDRAAARRAYEAATIVAPEWVVPWHNLGELRLLDGETDGAIDAFDRALTLGPDFVPSRLNRAYALLQLGRWQEGWREHEWRFGGAHTPPREGWEHTPVWRGQPLDGDLVVVWTEQGLGDSLQYVRFIEAIADRGGVPHVQAAPCLAALLATASGVDTVFTDQPPGPVDYQIPLMSLPQVLGIKGDVEPTRTAYLRPPVDPPTIATKAIRATSGPRVGVVWRSGRQYAQAARRDLDLASLETLASADGVSFFGLQYEGAPPIETMIDLSPYLGDFATTAAIVDELDLVITVDTAMAHLAGALGKPCWVLLSQPADWRWLEKRDDTPWYPRTRLFRQTTPGDWREPIADLVEALHSEPFDPAK
ncbi:MAG: tetratricopeptide repeat-containing glycosyltransferase family protein [Acidobacteriota bacterium]